jgi:hypothetical protein
MPGMAWSAVVGFWRIADGGRAGVLAPAFNPTPLVSTVRDRHVELVRALPAA